MFATKETTGIKNNAIKVKAGQITNLNQYGDKVPLSIDNTKIYEVIEVNPYRANYCDIIKTGDITNTATATIYTTPTDRDFFLSSVNLSVAKDAMSTSVETYVSVVIGGVTYYPIVLSGLTLNAQFQSQNISYALPLKLDRNSVVSLVNGTAVANIHSSVTITGFTMLNDTYDTTNSNVGGAFNG